ncbi:MAG: chemotaxis protein chel [Caulobacteraceae bacterium]|jgi:Rod binding domain-containing protein|nr:chemotaxis protein chel [Caulobacteraceae bacterium]
MSSPLAAPVDMLLAQGQSALRSDRSHIRQTAQAFEASFLSVMLSQMFDGVETPAPFGGGQGESMFKSLYTDAIARQVTRSGGVGIAASVEREMLKLQGLEEDLTHGA